jgi:hypothetical protein
MNRIPSYAFAALAMLVLLFAVRACAAAPAENPSVMTA